ncbi:MAG: amylo-alpha-1,6-glucosidase, partial [Candidatus Thermoplasmatota archaeon]|nr:amylo-alpha-1,6-glucosidase [Candidatus Thermoplasmatota archaeon]
VTSEPGHLILSGILSRDKERIIIDRLFEDDMMTPYGIRTMSTGDPYFDSRAYQRGSIWPNDNWLIAWGLRRRGYLKEYNEIKNRMLECALKLNGLPEYVGVDISGSIIKPDKMRIKPCYPQAWSSGAEIYFRTH